MRAEPRALARRYARALLDVASAAGADAPDLLRREIEDLVRLLATHGELRTALFSPRLAGARRRGVLAAVAEKAGASALLRRLLTALADGNRLELLPAIGVAYAAGLNGRRGILKATAISATPLDESQQQALTRTLCEAMGHKIELDTQVEPALLGGLLVRVGGRTYDGTVRAQLTALRHRLAAGR